MASPQSKRAVCGVNEEKYLDKISNWDGFTHRRETLQIRELPRHSTVGYVYAAWCPLFPDLVKIGVYWDSYLDSREIRRERGINLENRGEERVSMTLERIATEANLPRKFEIIAGIATENPYMEKSRAHHFFKGFRAPTPWIEFFAIQKATTVSYFRKLSIDLKLPFFPKLANYSLQSLSIQSISLSAPSIQSTAPQAKATTTTTKMSPEISAWAKPLYSKPQYIQDEKPQFIQDEQPQYIQHEQPQYIQDKNPQSVQDEKQQSSQPMQDDKAISVPSRLCAWDEPLIPKIVSARALSECMRCERAQASTQKQNQEPGRQEQAQEPLEMGKKCSDYGGDDVVREKSDGGGDDVVREKSDGGGADYVCDDVVGEKSDSMTSDDCASANSRKQRWRRNKYERKFGYGYQEKLTTTQGLFVAEMSDGVHISLGPCWATAHYNSLDPDSPPVCVVHMNIPTRVP